MDRIEYISFDVLIMYLMNEFKGTDTFRVVTTDDEIGRVEIKIAPTQKEPINNIDFLKFYAECEENRQ